MRKAKSKCAIVLPRRSRPTSLHNRPDTGIMIRSRFATDHPMYSLAKVVASAFVLLVVPICSAHASTHKQVRVLLVGDSTMARTTGYGDALCSRFDAAVICENRARGGRSTKSYRAEGLWDDVMTRLHAPEVRKTYVLI